MTYQCFSHHHFFESTIPCPQYNAPEWLPFAIFGGATTLLLLACCLISCRDRSHTQHTVREEPFNDDLLHGVVVTSYGAQ